jgi:hypothetical protein
MHCNNELAYTLSLLLLEGLGSSLPCLQSSVCLVNGDLLITNNCFNVFVLCGLLGVKNPSNRFSCGTI